MSELDCRVDDVRVCDSTHSYMSRVSRCEKSAGHAGAHGGVDEDGNLLIWGVKALDGDA